MSSKYSVSDRKRWQLRGDRPRIADHILGGPDEDGPGRWDERTPAGSVAPETAWEAGVDLDDSVLPWLTGEHSQPPHRARLFADRVDGDRYVAIFLVCDEDHPTATTIITPSMLDDPARRAYLHVRADEVLPDD